MSPNGALRASGITVNFGGIQALRNLDISLPAGQISAIIGPNGAGKSTLADVVSGFQAPDDGIVTLDGRDVTRVAPHIRARGGVVRTFQSPRIVPSLSVLENVLLAEQRYPSTSPFAATFKRRQTRMAEQGLIDRAYGVLERFGLSEVAQNRGPEISGGQRRLVEFARMTLVRARYLILDEPTAGVAPALRTEMVEHIKQLHELTQAAIIVIEHDMAVVEALAGGVYVLVNGQVLAEGTMEDVRRDERVLEAYLGGRLTANTATGDATNGAERA